MSDTAQTKVPAVTLGWRLRIAMEFADIKADEMAARLHVHRGTITRWTHDVGSAPRGIYIERWAELTGVPLDWLLGPDTSASPGRDTHRTQDATLLLSAA